MSDDRNKIDGKLLAQARRTDWQFDGIQYGLQDEPHSANFTNQGFLEAHHGMTVSIMFPVTAKKMREAFEAAEKRAVKGREAAA